MCLIFQRFTIGGRNGREKSERISEGKVVCQNAQNEQNGIRDNREQTFSSGNEPLEAAAEERQRETSNVAPGHAATDLNARFASVRRDNEYIGAN